MEFKPHDTLGKTVLSLLAPGRTLITEAELRTPSFGDVILRQGPPLPLFTGMLGAMVGEDLTLMEFFSSRPSLESLLRARAKAMMALASERLRMKREGSAEQLPELSNLRMIMIALGQAISTKQRAWQDTTWLHTQPGWWWIPGPPRTYFIDLLRLPLTSETCWLHLAGDGPQPQHTLDFIWRQGPEAERVMTALSEELPHMQMNPSDASSGPSRRFLTAMEEWSALQRGMERGIQLGLERGAYEGQMKLLRQLLERGTATRDELSAMLQQLEQLRQPAEGHEAHAS